MTTTRKQKTIPDAQRCIEPNVERSKWSYDANGRCKRRATEGGYCWQHARKRNWYQRAFARLAEM